MTLKWKEGPGIVWQADGCDGRYKIAVLNMGPMGRAFTCTFTPNERGEPRGLGGGSYLSWAKEAADKHEANRLQAKAGLIR